MNICLNIGILRDLMPYILVHRYRDFTVFCTRITAFASIVVSCWFVQVRSHSSFPIPGSLFFASRHLPWRQRKNIPSKFDTYGPISTQRNKPNDGNFHTHWCQNNHFRLLVSPAKQPIKNPKFSLCFNHVLRKEGIWESGGRAPLILNVGIGG